MTSFALAFVICALACILDEAISKWAKARAPSVVIADIFVKLL